jgi:hypothetical protein
MSANGTGGVDADPLVVAVRALTHKTTSSAELLAWAAADAAALDVVLAEKLKPRWANARFRAWQLRAGVLARSCGTMRAGRLEDGTAGVPLLAMYGDAKFSGSSRGRRAGAAASGAAAGGGGSGGDASSDASAILPVPTAQSWKK